MIPLARTSRLLVALLMQLIIVGCSPPPAKAPSPLEFRLVVAPSELTEEEIEQLNESQTELMQFNEYAWYPLANLKHWKSVVGASEHTDVAQRFHKLGMLAREHDGNVFVLLHTQPKYCITADSTWGIQSVRRTHDPLGRQVVAFELDRNGSARMEALSGPSIGKQLGILIDGELYAAPTLYTQLGRSAVISGDFSNHELSKMQQRLSQ